MSHVLHTYRCEYDIAHGIVTNEPNESKKQSAEAKPEAVKRSKTADLGLSDDDDFT